MPGLKIKNTETFMGRIAPGLDLLPELNKLCRDMDATLGTITGIGAVKRVTIGYFDQDAGQYIENRIDLPMEIVTLNANISMLDGQPFVHAHVALGDRHGRLYGGHLMPGTEIFVFEYILTVGEGNLERKPDNALNLNLWEV